MPASTQCLRRALAGLLAAYLSCEAAPATEDSSDAVARLVERADAAHSRGRHSAELRVLRKAASQGETSFDLKMRIANAFRETGNYVGARDALESAYEAATTIEDRHAAALTASVACAGLESLHPTSQQKHGELDSDTEVWVARALETSPGVNEFLGATRVWPLGFEASGKILRHFVEQDPLDDRAIVGARILASWESISTHEELLERHGELYVHPTGVDRPSPWWTTAARRLRFSGSAKVQLVLDETGRPAHIFIEKGLPYGMIESIVRAVLQWRFEPALVDSEPTPVRFSTTIEFDAPD